MNILEELVSTKEQDLVKFTYYYRLICSDLNVNMEDSASKFKAYGIEVERRDFKENSIENIERDAISNISPYRHKVKELLNVLYKNNVSPIHLVDILGSCVDECACDYQEDLIKKSV